jgi:23S rRNA pseudouridine1911/1915/1917 synthase
MLSRGRDHAVRLVDHTKAYLVVVRVDDVGPLIARGALSINGCRGRIGDLVQPTDVVAIDARQLADGLAIVPQQLALAVKYEDDALIVCAKPANMHVHPIGAYRDGTLLNGLLWHCGARPDRPWGRWRPRPLHRLDRAASGLVAFGKHAAVHDHMRQQLAAADIGRRYWALVDGHVDADAGTIDAPLGRDPACNYRRAVVPSTAGGQRAITHWRRIERRQDRTLLELSLETGRTHQIRAHLASIGHPIAGDVLYAQSGDRRDATSAIALHAVELRLRHPVSGDALVLASRPPWAVSGWHA